MHASFTSEDLQSRDIDADQNTVTARLEAYRDRQPRHLRPLLIPLNSTAAPPTDTVPEISAAQFSTESLRSALMEHGSLIVRGLYPEDAMNELRHAVDRVLDACACLEQPEEQPRGWHFNPLRLEEFLPRGKMELLNSRKFQRDSGSAMCVEAPSVAESLLDLYEAAGLREILQNYFEEEPCISAKKWILRRSLLPVAEQGWHQDGAFLGTDINSLNMWLPLNRCGGDTGAPGLDVLPRRLSSIASAEGAQFDWSVSSGQVASEAAGATILSPVFNAGDAYFFDHFLLHRTQFGKNYTANRYAIETWFFGGSNFPKDKAPLAW